MQGNDLDTPTLLSYSPWPCCAINISSLLDVVGRLFTNSCNGLEPFENYSTRLS